MKNIIKHSLYGILLVLCSCAERVIDEKYAASVVKKELSISGEAVAHKLSGGFSGTMNFLVSIGPKKYVVRFIQDREVASYEVYNFNVAWQEGYGPRVYYANQSRGIVIMEYLQGQKISIQDLQSNKIYVAAAQLLRKIHHGRSFKDSGFDIFKRLDHDLKSLKPAYSDCIPMARLEQAISIIHQALLPHLITTVPCHNDLHGGNRIFLGNEFKAIDYGDAGPGDPYFDVATIALDCDKEHEKILLTTYLGRQPTELEKAKLYLMKLLVLVKWIFALLDRLSPKDIRTYGSIKVPLMEDVLKEHRDLKLDLEQVCDRVKLLKIHLNQVFSDVESQEFNNAVSLLIKHII